MTGFPLCKRLGLTLHQGHRTSPDSPGYTSYVRSEELERILEAAPVGEAVIKEKHGWYWSQGGCMAKTHTARLLMIEPSNKKDTAESLLREWADAGDGGGAYVCTEKTSDWYKRVKALLGEK